MDVGSGCNIMAVYGDTEVHGGSGLETHGTDFYQLGCYYKLDLAALTCHSDKVKRDLVIFLFIERK